MLGGPERLRLNGDNARIRKRIGREQSELHLQLGVAVYLRLAAARKLGSPKRAKSPRVLDWHLEPPRRAERSPSGAWLGPAANSVGMRLAGW